MTSTGCTPSTTTATGCWNCGRARWPWARP
nr:MAG TPA_asm: co-chaperone HscB [Caudoviricetes sp.]